MWDPSRSGKTRFALSDIFGTKPLTVDVGDGQDLNLQSWDHRVHSHLVLDNVNASDVIMRRRLQNVPNNFAIGLKPFLSSQTASSSMEQITGFRPKVDEKCYVE